MSLLKEGLAIMSSNVKFKYFADLFLQLGENEWKPSTLYKYKNILTRLTFFYDRDIQTIKVSEIRLYLSSLKTHLTQKTIKDYKSVLHQIFDLAKFDEFITNNPVDFIRKLQTTKPKILPFNINETNLILNALHDKNINFAMFIRIGFFTGMRTGEILALKLKNICLEKRYICINKTKGAFGENEPKTLTSLRKIKILDDLYPYLEKFISSHLDRTYLLENQYNCSYVCLNSFQKIWKNMLKDLNIDYRKMYCMRHTFATHILKNDLLTPYELSRYLGHSTTQMIYDRYVKYLNDENEILNTNLNLYGATCEI